MGYISALTLLITTYAALCRRCLLKTMIPIDSDYDFRVGTGTVVEL